MNQEFEATACVELNLPRAEVWQRMQDLTQALYYVPGLLECRITTERRSGVGASRRVRTKHVAMDETVVEWTEGVGFVLRLHDGERPPPMFAQATCSYRIEEGAGNRTLLTHSISYVPRDGLVAALFDRLFMRWMIRRSARRVAEGLKRYYETGQPSNDTYRSA